MQTISYIIPCYRSEQYVTAVIDEIRHKAELIADCDYEIVAVDDCSPDNVFTVLSRLAEADSRCKVVRLAKNFGQHSAMMAGLKYATGDIMVFLDDDGQCPVSELDKLLEPLFSGKADVSIAIYGKKKQSLFKNFGTFIHELSANILIDKPKHIRMGNFMALRRYVAEEIIRYEGPYPHITGLFFRTSAHIVNVPMEERSRMYGNTTYTFHKLVSLWLNSFTAFSIKPLRIATFLGGLTATAGFIYAVYLIIRKIMTPEIPVGYSSMMCALLFIGGMIMLMLGLIGEYIGRIYICLNKAPQYVVRDTVNIGENVHLK